eukprot:c17721_g1_i1.p1 GENE.c17721_g1_i1~~c17721_g1_i1.p1  ORF type:complete len:366 (-),score=90.85 c17721_g1_i1:158-1255(-)
MRVLVIGGESMQHTLGTCELFDPDTNTITESHNHSFTARDTRAAGGSPKGITPRTKFGVCCVQGRVIVCGGEAENAMAMKSVEWMDVRKGVWMNGPDMNVPRIGCAVSASPSGAVYVCGGATEQNIYTNVIERLDADMAQWTVIAQLLIPRGFACCVCGVAIAASDSRKETLLVFGGRNNNNEVERSVEAIVLEQAPAPRMSVIGKLLTHRRPVPTFTSTVVCQMPVPVMEASLVLGVKNTDVILVGGQTNTDPTIPIHSGVIQQFDTLTNTWTIQPSPLTRRTLCAVAGPLRTRNQLVWNTYVAFGGFTTNNYLDEVVLFAVDHNKWVSIGNEEHLDRSSIEVGTVVCRMNCAKRGCGAVVVTM